MKRPANKKNKEKGRGRGMIGTREERVVSALL